MASGLRGADSSDEEVTMAELERVAIASLPKKAREAGGGSAGAGAEDKVSRTAAAALLRTTIAALR